MAQKKTALDKQILKIAADVQQTLKLPEDKAPLIQRYTRRAVNRILVYCSRPDLPELLEDVAAQIVEDMLHYDNQAGDNTSDGIISSISRGDTTISYKDRRSSYTETVEFARNYKSLLIPFKRMKIPRNAEADKND